MAKSSSIQIHDARRSNKRGGFRVKSVAKNGEVLQTSQVLDTVQAVAKHINAMHECWDGFRSIVCDHTKSGIFSKKGIKAWSIYRR